MASESEYVTCPRCGMGWPTRALCSRCISRLGGADPDCQVCHGTLDAGLTPAHECPEPYPPEVARMILEASRHAPVHPRIAARARLGLGQRSLGQAVMPIAEGELMSVDLELGLAAPVWPGDAEPG